MVLHSALRGPIYDVAEVVKLELLEIEKCPSIIVYRLSMQAFSICPLHK